MVSEFVEDSFLYATNGTNIGPEGENSSFEKDTMLSNENFSGFITDSPFSFRNPIFFSVPRDNNFKDTKPIASKRQLFTVDENEPHKTIVS